MSSSSSSASSSLKIASTSLIECGQNRITSRSVSWNSGGGSVDYLAMGSSDRMAHILTLDSASSREVLVVSGHTSPVSKVRFHPQQATQLASAGSTDGTVRLWDIRGATQRAMGTISLAAAVTNALSVEWSPTQNSHLVVTERSGNISIYDIRKLSVPKGGRPTTTLPLCSYSLAPHIPEVAVFSPKGTHLVTGTSLRGDSVGELRMWPVVQEDLVSSSLSSNKPMEPKNATVIPAHSGPIYSLAFSPDGRRLATGGADATAGLWDTASMCCMASLARRTKFIRHLAFSPKTTTSSSTKQQHPQKQQLLAVCSEDPGVDILETSTGAHVGVAQLGSKAGAEEVAWHPKHESTLACARVTPPGSPPVAPVVVVRLALSGATQ